MLHRGERALPQGIDCVWVRVSARQPTNYSKLAFKICEYLLPVSADERHGYIQLFAAKEATDSFSNFCRVP